MMCPALVALLLTAEEPAAAEALERGMAAFREGRYAEALPFLDQAAAAGAGYDALVALGLARGRLERLDEAAEAFDRALALDPARPEAWLERGGLRFLQRRYAEAVRDLEQALRRRDETYTRDLLASSLYLDGRSDDALACWNALGQPILRWISIGRLVHTKDRVVRRELRMAEGEVLDLEGLRESRRRLEELRVFDRVTLRPLPLGEGKADLEVALAEQHGFASSLTEFVVSTGVSAAQGRLRLRYANLGGIGVSLGGSYRFSENQPEASLFVSWPRPFGVPVRLRLAGFRGEQAYDLGEPFRIRRRGLDLGVREVLGARTTGLVLIRCRDRSSFVTEPDAPPGAIVGLGVGIERLLFQTYRQRLDVSASAFSTVRSFGSDLSYTQWDFDVAYEARLRLAENVRLEPVALAARLRVGWASSGQPVDEMYATGGSPEMDLPLRAHHLTRNGVIGASPVGRSILLVNLEWRRRLVRRPWVQLGLVLFYDGAHVGRVPGGDPVAVRHDVGCGLRIGFTGAPLLRVDYGHGLADGANAVFVGLNQVF